MQSEEEEWSLSVGYSYVDWLARCMGGHYDKLSTAKKYVSSEKQNYEDMYKKMLKIDKRKVIRSFREIVKDWFLDKVKIDQYRVSRKK